MARTEIPLIVLDPATGNAVVGASVAVKDRVTGNSSTVYAAETGATTVTNPRTTDAYGRVAGWIERGSYQFDISGTGLVSYTEYYESSPGGDGTIDTNWITSSAVTTAKLADDSVTADKLAPKPYAELRRLTNQNVADNTFAGIGQTAGYTWTDSAFDNGVATTGTALANVANGTIALNRVGQWLISGSCAWDASNVGWRSLAIYWSALFGSPVAQDINTQGFGGLFGLTQTVSTVVHVNAPNVGSTVNVNVYQNSGGTRTLNPIYLRAAWIGPHS